MNSKKKKNFFGGDAKPDFFYPVLNRAVGVSATTDLKAIGNFTPQKIKMTPSVLYKLASGTAV